MKTTMKTLTISVLALFVLSIFPAAFADLDIGVDTANNVTGTISTTDKEDSSVSTNSKLGAKLELKKDKEKKIDQKETKMDQKFQDKKEKQDKKFAKMETKFEDKKVKFDAVIERQRMKMEQVKERRLTMQAIFEKNKEERKKAAETYNDKKEEFKTAKKDWQDKKQTDTTLVAKGKEFLHSHIARMEELVQAHVTILTELSTRVQNSNIPDEKKADLLERITAQLETEKTNLDTLEKVNAEIDAGASLDDLHKIAAELKVVVSNHGKAGEGVVDIKAEHLLDRLNSVYAKIQARITNAKGVDKADFSDFEKQYEAKAESAKQHIANAQAAISTEGAKESEKRANTLRAKAELKSATEDVRSAHDVLVHIQKALAQLKIHVDISGESQEDTSTEINTTDKTTATEETDASVQTNVTAST